jgi:hypothetical protein
MRLKLTELFVQQQVLGFLTKQLEGGCMNAACMQEGELLALYCCLCTELQE